MSTESSENTRYVRVTLTVAQRDLLVRLVNQSITPALFGMAEAIVAALTEGDEFE